MRKKPRLIQSVTINPERGQALKDKTIELFEANREIVKESQLVAFLIDEALELVEMDEYGLYIREKEEKEG